MDLYQLRYFLEVARELSFTRAAENLRISTPAVSRSVALLESSLGRRLLIRTRRHVELTSYGEKLKVEAQRIYDVLECVQRDLRDESDAPELLKIGSREMITNYLLTPALKTFGSKYPKTRFGIYELSPRQMAEALKKDLIDFAFYYSADIPDPALEIIRVGSVSSHVYASKELLPDGRAPRGVEAVLALPFIAPRYFRADPTEPSADGFPDQRMARTIRFEGEFFETHRRFVLDGLAAAVLPDFVVREDLKAGRVVRLKGPELGREIYFLKRRGRPLPRSIDLFLDAVRRVIARL